MNETPENVGSNVDASPVVLTRWKFDYVAFGAALKEHRTSNGLTLRVASDQTFVSPSELCRIEQGKRESIGSTNLIALASWARVNLHDFVQAFANA